MSELSERIRRNMTPNLDGWMLRLMEEAASDIERRELEREEMVAGFSAATRGMDHKAVFELTTAAKEYVAARRNQNNS